MTEGAKAGVFDAWAVARRDIFEKWTALTDPASLSPELPRAIRDAAELVQDHGAFLGGEEQQDLFNRLRGRWPTRIVSEIREIVRTDGSPQGKVKSLYRFVVEEQALDVPERADPLDPIDISEIRLVCWMAVRPER